MPRLVDTHKTQPSSVASVGIEPTFPYKHTGVLVHLDEEAIARFNDGGPNHCHPAQYDQPVSRGTLVALDGLEPSSPCKHMDVLVQLDDNAEIMSGFSPAHEEVCRSQR